MSAFSDAVRTLRRSPGTATLAAIALALGIGSTTTMYSITRGILRELPVERPDRLVHLASVERAHGSEYQRIPVPDLIAIREQQRSFESLAAYEDESIHLGDTEHHAVRASAGMVTASTFTALRVSPLLGRALTPADERPGAPAVAVLGYALWQSRYGGDPRIIGRIVRVNGVPTTVVGVMPDGFAFPLREQLWLPLALDAAPTTTDVPAYNVIARLRDNASIESAGADIATIGRRIAEADPASHAGRSLRVRSFHDEMVPPTARTIFGAMLLVVSFVLLIACANVANLLLARAVVRSREIAVRVALGATPRALITQLLAESLAIAIPGGVLGLLIAWAGVTIFNQQLGFELEYWMRVEVDGTVLAFTTALVVVAALAAGLAPALQAARVSVGDVLKDESRGTSSFRMGRASRVLVISEVALSCALLIVTGLMVKGVLNVTTSNVGLAPERVASGRIELRQDAYPTAAARTRFFEALETRLASEPGVTSATIALSLPGNSTSSVPIEIGGVRYDDPDTRPRTRSIAVSPSFFETFGVSMQQGRGFSRADRAGAPRVAIVNRALAERLFGGNPVGRQVRLEDTGAWITIVGVVPVLGTVSGKHDQPGGNDAIYTPLAQSELTNVAVAARTAGDASAFVARMRDLVAQLDPDIPMYQAGRLDMMLARTSTGEKVFGGLFTFFGVAALVLAVVGLVGVLAFSVSRRTRELGIRVALGGQSSSIAWLVLRGGLAQMALGTVIGLTIAATLAPQLGDALSNDRPHDPVLYAAIAVLLLVVGAVAAVVPVRRALRIDPMVALRAE